MIAFSRLASAQTTVGWRMDGTGNFPAADAPIAWSPTDHVLWSTPMPSASNASPILVGDRIFVSSEPNTLICLNAASGRILWQRANPVEDTVSTSRDGPHFFQATSQQHQAQLSLREKDYDLTAIRQRLRKAPDDQERIQESKALETQTDELRQRLAALAPLVPPMLDEQSGFTSPTPTSDGDGVYVLFSSGVAASYDLEGKRRWIKFVEQPQDREDASGSPVLSGDKLLLHITDLIALDKVTGDFRWRANVPHRNGTPVAFQIEGEDFVITPSGHCVRVADGTIVASGLGDLPYASPLIRDHVLYMISEYAQAFRIPERMADPLVFPSLWATRLRGSIFYASPLQLDGLVYAIRRNQILDVLDAATGAQVYTEKLNLGPMGGVNGAYASPAQGGRYVFVSGLGGTTVVLKPGRRYEHVASNELEKVRASPVFDGNRMYVRGYRNLYCISSPTERTASQDPSKP